MSDDVLQLDPRIGWIDAHRNCADHLGAEVGVRAALRVAALTREPVLVERGVTEQVLPLGGQLSVRGRRVDHVGGL